MTEIVNDLVTALSEDVAANIDRVSAVKSQHTYIYSSAQLTLIGQNTSLPHVFYAYAGILPDGKTHKCLFDLFLFAPAQTLTKVSGNRVMPLATAILNDLRKAMACNHPRTLRGWELQSELPDLSDDDSLAYRQRWATNCQIKN
jgi:hypothetical protein